jgi:hypothetical protein
MHSTNMFFECEHRERGDGCLDSDLSPEKTRPAAGVRGIPRAARESMRPCFAAALFAQEIVLSLKCIDLMKLINREGERFAMARPSHGVGLRRARVKAVTA